ncbi:MAG: hypothetical protein ABI268_01185 [Rhodanobacter sp.]
MTLAVERNERSHVKGRKLVRANLGSYQLAEPETIPQPLAPRYGAIVAMRRTTHCGGEARSSMTGSRVTTMTGSNPNDSKCMKTIGTTIVEPLTPVQG